MEVDVHEEKKIREKKMMMKKLFITPNKEINKDRKTNKQTQKIMKKGKFK